MCKVSRRAFLATNAGFLTAAAEAELLGRARQIPPPPARPNEVAPGIFFFEGDPFATGSNRGWVVFSEYVLVIDASFPAGAEQTVRAIRATTDRPIRFAFDTHHHGDHAVREPGVHPAGRHRRGPRRCPRGDATGRVRVLSAGHRAAGRTKPGRVKT